MKRLYSYYLNIVFLLAFLSWYVPVLVLVQIISLLILLIFALIVYVFVGFIWIPRYYDMIFYRLTDSEIV
ncbi:MAG: hypothetical protein ACUVQ8_02295 [Nitrososphaeria archaeon]